MEKEMANHSSVLAWRIPGMGEPGGLPSTGSHRVGHDWSDLAARLCEINSLVGCCAVAQSCLTATPWTAEWQASLSFTTPGFAQPHVHWAASPPVLNLSQHQGFFQWVGSSHQVAKVLEFPLQHQSFQWIFSVDFI